MTDLSITPMVKPGAHAPKTAAEAMVHAEAKAGIRDAKNLRRAGVVLAGAGLYYAYRDIAPQLAYHRITAGFVHVTLFPSHLFDLSLFGAFGLLAIPVGLGMLVAGQVLRSRRVAAALANPATVGIFSADAKWGGEDDDATA